MEGDVEQHGGKDILTSYSRKVSESGTSWLLCHLSLTSDSEMPRAQELEQLGKASLLRVPGGILKSLLLEWNARLTGARSTGLLHHDDRRIRAHGNL